MLQRSCIAALSLVLVAACAAPADPEEDVGSAEDALVGGCDPDRLIANAPPARKEILRRAAKWIRDPVPYSQTEWKDSHRTDCSGYVSLAWGRSDFTTAQIPPRSTSTGVARTITWDEILPGDAIARGPSVFDSGGHVMLYAGTDYLGFACLWEQNKPSTQISSYLKAELTGDYVPIRKSGL